MSVERFDLQRFPGIAKLLGTGAARRSIPYVPQYARTDCGVACLSMVLRYYGRAVDPHELERLGDNQRDGLGADKILSIGEMYGLRGRGVSLDLEHLADLPRGAILHWEFRHFVVFERVRKNGIEIVDPGVGRRVIPLQAFAKSFTGVVLLLEPGEQFERAGPKRRESRYGRVLRRHWKKILRVMATSLFLRVVALLLPFLTAMVADRVIPYSDGDLLTVVSIGTVGLLLFRTLVELIRAHSILELRAVLDLRLTLDLLEHLFCLPFPFFQRHSIGDLLLRVSSTATIREMFTSTLLAALLDGPLACIYLVVLFILEPRLGAIVAVVGVLEVAVLRIARQPYRDVTALLLQRQARSDGYITEALSGVESLKAAGAERRTVRHWSNLFVDEVNVSLQKSRLTMWVEAGSQLLQQVAPIVVLCYGSVLVIDGELTLGTMLAVSGIAVGFLGPLSGLLDAGLKVQEMYSYVERIEDVFRHQREDATTEQSPTLSRLSGAVRAESVSYRYDRNSPYVVKDVSFAAHPGQRIAIVGRSGSGKSTLAKLLAGLYVPSDGLITYDDYDARSMPIRAIRAQMGFVAQDAHVFGASIRDNIALAHPERPLASVVGAAKKACIHEFVMGLPMGYDTVLAPSGSSISGGQRQRVALARALVDDPRILILDEATSALDTETERRVVDSLRGLRCTQIVLAHRLSTIASADLILVMDEGRVVARGTHTDLMRAGGVYRELVEGQLSSDRGQGGIA